MAQWLSRRVPSPFILAIMTLLVLDLARSALFISGARPVPEADAAQYWEMGHSVASGDLLLGTHEIAYRTPGYPWLVGILRLLFGRHGLLALMIVQAILVAATHAFLSATVWHITRSRAAVIATLLLGVGSVSRGTFVTLVLTETTFAFLLTAHLWSCVRWWRQESNLLAASIGLSLGVLILARPVAMYLPLAHLLALAVYFLYPRFAGGVGIDGRRRSGREVARMGMIAAGVVAVVVSPWILRNQRMFGRPFVTEFVGRNIWIVTYQDGAGAGLALPDSPASHALRRIAALSDEPVDLSRTWEVSDALTSAGIADPEADRLMRQVAVQSIQENPSVWMVAAVRRFVNYWRCVSNDLPVLGNRAPSSSLLWSSAYAIAALAGALCALGHRDVRGYAFWLLSILLYFGSVTALVEIPDYRYRMVVEPQMIALMVLGGYALFTMRSQGVSR